MSGYDFKQFFSCQLIVFMVHDSCKKVVNIVKSFSWIEQKHRKCINLPFPELFESRTGTNLLHLPFSSWNNWNHWEKLLMEFFKWWEKKNFLVVCKGMKFYKTFFSGNSHTIYRLWFVAKWLKLIKWRHQRSLTRLKSWKFSTGTLQTFFFFCFHLLLLWSRTLEKNNQNLLNENQNVAETKEKKPTYFNTILLGSF